ncbi:MAG: PilZ domain-containing protein [Elusimicrobiota bacterium]
MRITRLLEKAKEKISASFNSPDSEAIRFAEEKRRLPRHSTDFDVQLLDVQSRPADEAVRLVDLSGFGVGIETCQSLAVGQTLGFRMRVGDSSPVKAMARVRWTRPAGFRYAYGLEIEGLSWWSRRRLMNALQPGSFDFERILNTALQAASTLMVIYVIGDWLSRHPDTLPSLVFILPYFVCVFAVAITLWMFPRY